MGSNYWIKMYHEALHDPKMGRLSDHLWRRFFELCLIAGETDAAGELPPAGDMAWTLRTTPGDMEADLHLLAENKLIHLNDECWVVTKFATRQAPIGDADRKRRQRERDKKSDYYSHVPVTEDVTNCDTDTDTDTESETESDQDTESASDNIPRDAENPAAVADVLEAVHDLGITDPKATHLVTAYAERGDLPQLVPRLQGWIEHYADNDGIKNRVGLAIRHTEDRMGAPAAPPDPWADIVEQ